MARSTHGARKGRWYFEVKIISLPDDTAIRVESNKKQNLKKKQKFLRQKEYQKKF